MSIQISMTTGEARPTDPNNPDDVAQAEKHNAEQEAEAREFDTVMSKQDWTREDALYILKEYGGHSYMSPDMARRIAQPFGFKPRVEKVRNEGPAGMFTKGLYVEGKEVGAIVQGVSGYNLAEGIARHLDPEYSNNLMGRGFRFRNACGRIEKAINAEKE